jgi:hypothetical protein
MKTEKHYFWNVLSGKKWVQTRFRCSEEFIRIEHPEATLVEGTLVLREIPETDEELAARYRLLTPSQNLQPYNR